MPPASPHQLSRLRSRSLRLRPQKRVSALMLIVCVCGWAGGARAQSAPPVNYEPYTFGTLAGLAPGTADGNGSAARFAEPGGCAVDSAGTVYVADTANHTIRKITPAGDVSTFAGKPGGAGYSNATGSDALFQQPAGIAIDGNGNLYVADRLNHVIRRITPGGAVTLFAGGAGAPGIADGTTGARFNSPTGVAVDSVGNVYVADTANHTIRKITPPPSGGGVGTVSTLAGSPGLSGNANGTGTQARFNSPFGVAVDANGAVYVGDTGNHTIRRITAAGAASTLSGAPGTPGSSDGVNTAARFNLPAGVVVGSNGSVYVADSGNHTIRRVVAAGITQGSTSTLAGLAGSAGSADGNGNAARFNMPLGVALDGSGRVFVADTANSTIRRISTAADVITLAGSASPGSSDGNGIGARFSHPAGIATTNAGDVIVADRRNHTIRKVTPAGDVTTIAGVPGSIGSANGTGSEARFHAPGDVAVDGAGTIYVADTGNHTIRKITAAGVVSTLAGSPGVAGFANATGSQARFNTPSGLAVAGDGSVYVADTANNTIRRIAPDAVVSSYGTVSTSEPFIAPEGIAVAGDGSVYVANTGSHTIRRIAPNQTVTTLAGSAGVTGFADGTGAAALFTDPQAVDVDSANNVYVADTGNHTVRKITPARVVTTLAGLRSNTGSVDGVGNQVRFFGLEGVAADSAGKVYVGDTSNNTVRSAAKLLPPVITSPLGVRLTIGQPFYYLLKGTGDPAGYGASNMPPGISYDPFLDALVGTPTATGEFQCNLSASNAAGTTTEVLTMRIQGVPASGLTISSSYSSSGRPGVPFEFQVITTGGSAATRIAASNLPPGLVIDEMTGLISGTPTADGSFSVSLTATDGANSTTETLQLTFISDPGVPVIITPSSAMVSEGVPFSYTIAAPATTDSADNTQFTMIGNLPNGLGFDSSTGQIVGTYTPPSATTRAARGKPLSGGVITNVQLFATNSQGTSTIPLVFFLAPKGVVNISTRLAIGTDQNVLIAGFIVTGNAPKKLMIRAIAPSLGIGGALQDPTLELRDGENLLGANDDWRSAQEQDIVATTIPPTDNRESALVAILQPGAYTAVIAGKDGSTGIGLAEVYDLGTASLDSTSDSKLANISTRGFVQTDDNVMIGGFIVSGAPTKVIVRAVGPSLANRGVAGSIDDTTLDFVDGNGALIVSNDDWRTGGQEQQIIDTTVPPDDNRESAVVATINPGGYTAVVRGKGGSTGVALVEVYVLN